MKVVVTLDLDFELLRKQKYELLQYCWQDDKTDKFLEGILSLIDTMQDQSVDQNGVDEKVVFGEPIKETV